MIVDSDSERRGGELPIESLLGSRIGRWTLQRAASAQQNEPKHRKAYPGFPNPTPKPIASLPDSEIRL